ncbi:hypothetical protein FRC20_006458 [Serendipita sp. 405]|nr:hypothetical protein FRC20_006458 [Serendipita sp. 405]
MQESKFNQPVYGNYHGYYIKRSNISSSLDPRLNLLPDDIFKGKRVLDLGCNEGWLTVDIAQHFHPSKVIGVDIDGDLIRGAWKRRRTVWSMQRCSTSGSGNFSPSASPSDFEEGGSISSRRGTKRKRIESHIPTSIHDAFTSLYPTSQIPSSGPGSDPVFPLSMEYMFGPLPIPPVSMIDPSLHSAFPHNISFYTADWTRAVQENVSKVVGTEPDTQDISGIVKEDKMGYDIVIAFSITKWIHLNGGDEGLLAFFRKIHSVLRPGPTGKGGVLLLEPQDWEGYAKARKLSKVLTENYKTLQLRPSDFSRVLTEMGFIEEDTYAKGGDGGFKRSILMFRKR